MIFHLPNEEMRHPYLGAHLKETPQVGAIIRITRSDNEDLVGGDFKVVQVVYSVEVVNKSYTKDNLIGGNPMVVLERVS